MPLPSPAARPGVPQARPVRALPSGTTRFPSITRLGPAMPRNGPEPVTGTPDGSGEWWERGGRGFPPPTRRSDRGEVEAPRTGDRYARALPFPWRPPRAALSWAGGAVRPETPLQPSPEQLALDRRPPRRPGRLPARARLRRRRQDHRAAAAGRGRPLPRPLPGLQQGRPAPGPGPLPGPRRLPHRPQPRLPRHRMFEQRHRLERRLAAREVAELLAIPALDGLRPSFWAYCAIAAVRAFTHGADREIDAGHLPPLPRGADRAEAVLAWARRLWGLMCRPGGDGAARARRLPQALAPPDGARLPAGAEVLYLDEAQDANPVTLAVLEAQRPADGVGRRPVAVGLPLPRQRGRDADDRRPAAAPEPLLALRRGAGRGRPRHPRPHRRAAGRAAARRPRDRHHARPGAPALRGAVPDQRRPVRGGGARPRPDPRRGRPRAAGAAGAGRLGPLPGRARAGGAGAGPVPGLGRAAGGGGGGPRPGAALPGARRRAVRPRPAGPGGGPAAAGGGAAGGGGPGAGDGAQGQGAGVAGGAAGRRTSRAFAELDAADPDGVPRLAAEERDQELHLLYVAATRARRRLEPNQAVRSCLAAPPGPAVADRGRAA